MPHTAAEISIITRQDRQSMYILSQKEPKKGDISKYQAKSENTDTSF